jgi:hypothetical protein
MFRLNHETNNRLDEINKDVNAIEATQIATELIYRISDSSIRDDAIRELAKSLRTNKIAARQ